MAAGKEAGRNPYHQHLYKVKIDGSQLTLLTPEDAHHSISFAPNGQYFIDNYSTATQPTRTVLRAASNGKILLELGKANIESLKAKGWKAPQVFTAIGRDGKTKIYGALWKPTNFDPAKTIISFFSYSYSAYQPISTHAGYGDANSRRP